MNNRQLLLKMIGGKISEPSISRTDSGRTIINVEGPEGGEIVLSLDVYNNLKSIIENVNTSI